VLRPLAYLLHPVLTQAIPVETLYEVRLWILNFAPRQPCDVGKGFMNTNTEHLIEALCSNWQAEMRSYHTYSALSQQEAEPHRRRVLSNLALAEKHHADLWAVRLTALDSPVPDYAGSESGEAGSLASRIGGQGLALRRLELDESRDIARYGKQIRELGDESSVTVLKEVLADEADHYNTLGGLIRHHLPTEPLAPELAQQALDELVSAREQGQPKAAI
jgi:rubrerythrin